MGVGHTVPQAVSMWASPGFRIDWNSQAVHSGKRPNMDVLRRRCGPLAFPPAQPIGPTDARDDGAPEQVLQAFPRMNEYITRKSEIYARACQGLLRVLKSQGRSRPWSSTTSFRWGSSRGAWDRYQGTSSRGDDEFQEARDPLTPHLQEAWPFPLDLMATIPQGIKVSKGGGHRAEGRQDDQHWWSDHWSWRDTWSDEAKWKQEASALLPELSRVGICSSTATWTPMSGTW